MIRLLSVFISVLFFSVLALAQDVGLKIDTSGSTSTEDTTISIKKGSNSTANKKKYTISEGSEEIIGDKDVLKKNAEKNWKQSCDDWKKEIDTNYWESHFLKSADTRKLLKVQYEDYKNVLIDVGLAR